MLSESGAPRASLEKEAFLIGNHADELTPWVPLLSTLYSASGYLSIPCCSWSFDSRYERSKCTPYPVSGPFDDFVESLNLGGDGSNASAYSMYRIWLASLSYHCGWKVESETLRIPSTRNWALVGASFRVIVRFSNRGSLKCDREVTYLDGRSGCRRRGPKCQGNHSKCAREGYLQDKDTGGKKRRSLRLHCDNEMQRT